jgi:hypothetical protein
MRLLFSLKSNIFTMHCHMNVEVHKLVATSAHAPHSRFQLLLYLGSEIPSKYLLLQRFQSLCLL